MYMVNGKLGNHQLTAQQRIDKAVAAIMRNEKYVALQGIIMLGARSIDNNKTKTACTNGRDEWYNEEFVDGLSDPELRFLILHECGHKMYRHLITWKHLYTTDPDRANRACDYVLNVGILDDDEGAGFVAMPEGGCYDPKYRGWDSAAVFNDLPPSDGNSGKGSGGDGAGLDEHDWDGAEDMSAEEQQDLQKQVDDALRQGALVGRKLGTGELRGFSDLLKPQVDWREVLRDFVTSTCAGNDYSTWSRPNRRYIGAGMYMPSGISERIGELVLAIDTSGSISQSQLSVFMSEIKSICETVRPEAVRVLYWGSDVVKDEHYTSAEVSQLTQSTKPADGGGTHPPAVPKYMQKKGINPQAVVVLTDGYVREWGSWTCPVLWVIQGRSGVTAPVGKTLHVNNI